MCKLMRMVMSSGNCVCFFFWQRQQEALRLKGKEKNLSVQADLELPVCHVFLVRWKHGYELRFVMLFKISTES